MKFKKMCATVLAATMVAATLTGCGSASSSKSSTTAKKTDEVKKVSLTVWGPQEDQAKMEGYDEGILKAMCDKFNEKHPEWDITFSYGVCGEDKAKDEVTKDLEAAGDVYMFSNDQIPVLTKAGALSELGGKTVDQVKADNDETMINSVTYEGGVYGVPYTSNTWFMYYDKSKYSEDEVKDLDTMMKKDLGKDVTNFAFPLDNSWYIAGFYYAAGGTLFGDGTDASKGCTFDDENGQKMTKYLMDLTNNKKFSCEKDGSSIAKFKDGKLGAYCSGSWDAEAIKEALGDNFAATKVPAVNGGQMKSFAGSKAVGVNPTTKNPEVAVALAAYLGSEECQQIRFETRGIIPTNKTVAASDAVSKDVVAQAQALEISEGSTVQPLLSEMDNYWKPAETMGKELVQGNVKDGNYAEKTKTMVKGILGKQ